MNISSLEVSAKGLKTIWHDEDPRLFCSADFCGKGNQTSLGSTWKALIQA